MTKIAARVVALGGSVSTMSWPDAPEKGDAADLVEQGGTADDVRALMDAAERWEAPKAPGPRIVCLDDVVREEVNWRWRRAATNDGYTEK